MTAAATQTTENKRNRRVASPATHAAAAESVRQLIAFTLTDRSKAQGALFNIAEPTENGPLMSGSLDLGGGKRVPLCGFLKQAKESDMQYLGLSLGEENGVHYYGKLFRQDGEKKGHNAPDYTGFLTVLAVEPGADPHTNDEWDNAPTLKVCGWRRRNAEGGARIALVVSSNIVDQNETAY